MENGKVGAIIRTLRLERKMTQKQLADELNISDKTVSKWERGLGCPDISILSELANFLEVDTQRLLAGDITPNDLVAGNMKNTKYYVCPICHNITFCTGNAEISCCGKKLVPQIMKKAQGDQRLQVETIESDWYITSNFSMTKRCYISFVAFVNDDSFEMVKQYPEWNVHLRIHQRGHGMLIWYHTEEGLLYQLMKGKNGLR